MSRQKLKSFLLKLDEELKGSSKTYRREADGKEMTFVYNANLLVKELEKEFKFRHLEKLFEKANVQKFMIRGANNVLASCRAKAKSFKGKRGVLIRSNQYSIKVSLAVEKNPKTDRNYSNFTKLKQVYKDAMDDFVLDLNAFLKKNYNTKLTKTRKKFDKETYKSSLINTDEEIKFGSDLIEGGHEKGEGILESRMRDAIDKAINDNYTDKAKKEVLESNMKELGIKLGFERNDKTDTHTIYAQSRVENQEAGMFSSDEKSRFRKELKKAIERLDDSMPIKRLKGSDSIEQIKVKQVTAAVMSEYKKKKNIKTSKVVKPKLTKRKSIVSTKRKKTKTLESAIPVIKIAVTKLKKPKEKQAKGPAQQPLQLIGIINKELPATVRKNMQLPALQNRTGRFADSVRVTDVIQTPKGHPSIGYTYQRNPYQVFENTSGGPWANGERDPRELIDKSIREIAIQFAIGRFYTRRV